MGYKGYSLSSLFLTCFKGKEDTRCVYFLTGVNDVSKDFILLFIYIYIYVYVNFKLYSAFILVHL